MSTAARRAVYSFEDFCALVPDGRKADLIDGAISMASPDNTDANDLFVWLITLLFEFVELKDLGKVYGSRVACRLDDTNGPEPDLLFVRKSRLHLVRRGYIAGAPDLVMEIVSPESEERDYRKKRRRYQEFGVPEYWIIDEEVKKVRLLRLDAAGKYREVRPRKGKYQSQTLRGFWLRAEWLWQETRPRKAEALAEILR